MTRLEELMEAALQKHPPKDLWGPTYWKVYQEGFRQGFREGYRDGIGLILQGGFGKLTAGQLERLARADDDALIRYSDRLATADSVDAVLAD